MNGRTPSPSPDRSPGRLSEAGAVVPPDLIATLVFGRYGAGALAARHDDVRLGRMADLVEALFPHLESDVALV